MNKKEGEETDGDGDGDAAKGAVTANWMLILE